MPRLLAFCAMLALAAGFDARAQDYLIQIGDRLDVSVIEDPGLNRQVLVRPDGRITLPLAGTLDAAGSSPEALQRVIRRRLGASFIEPPTVTVALAALGAEALVDQAGAITIYVLGQVGAPGRYDLEGPIDLLQALAVSGGPGVFAARGRIQLRRRGDAGEQVFLFDYETVEAGGVPTPHITLADGDVIVVPERGLFE